MLQLLIGLLTAGRPSYWRDEAATLSVAQRSIGDMLSLLAQADAVHGLYYLVQGSVLSVVGTDPLPARMLSVVAIALTVAFIVVLGERLAGPRAGIYAGVIASFLPGLIWASSELRSAALSALLAVLTMLALERATRKYSVTPWLLYAFLLALSTWFFVFAALLALPAAVLAATRARVKPFILYSSLSALVSLPIVVITSRQVSQVAWISEESDEVFASALIGQYFFGQRPYDGFAQPVAVFAVALATLTFTVIAWFSRAVVTSRKWSTWAVGLTWTVAPTVALLVVTAFVKPVYLERYLTFTAPGLCILMGATLAVMPVRPALAAVSAFCVLATPVLIAQKDEGAQWDNYAAVARFVDARKIPGAAAIYSKVWAHGVPVSYPDQFAGIDDAALDGGPLETNSFWGRFTPAPDIDLGALSGRQVFVFTLTEYEDSYPSAVDPYSLVEQDPYMERMLEAGCRVGDVSAATTITAYVFNC